MATTSRRAEAKSKKARRSNGGLSKPCSCGRSNWDKAPCRDLHSWRLNFQCQPPGGATTNFRVKLGRLSRAEAKRKAEEARVLLRKGEHPVQLEARLRLAEDLAPTDRPLTFAEVGQAWHDTRSAATQRNDACRLKLMCAWETTSGAKLGALPVTEVGESHVEGYLRHLTASGKQASTRNKVLGIFRMVGRFAVNRGHRTSGFFDPARLERGSILRRSKEHSRSRRLRPEDEQFLREVLESRTPRLRRLFDFLLQSACRLGEALKLEWRDVDLDRGVVSLRHETTKTATARQIPIASSRMARARFALEQARYLPNGEPMPPHAHPFGDELGFEVKCVKTSWWAALKAAAAKAEKERRPGGGAPFLGLRLHDLRHEGASRLAEDGLNVSHVMRLLGHTSLQTTTRYINSTALDVARALAQLDAATAAVASSQNGSQSGRTKRVPTGKRKAPATAQPSVM